MERIERRIIRLRETEQRQGCDREQKQKISERENGAETEKDKR